MLKAVRDKSNLAGTGVSGYDFSFSVPIASHCPHFYLFTTEYRLKLHVVSRAQEPM